MIYRCPNQTNLRAVALAGLLVVAVSPAPAQEPGGNPFEGEWSLTFDVNTPPGGVTLLYHSPYHMAFHASKRSFQVQADGTFTWREVEDGSLQINSTFNPGAGTLWESHQPLLKAGGTAIATPTPPGSPQPFDRSLEVNLDWSGGNGAHGSNFPAFGESGAASSSGTYVVDAAGEQMTVTGGGNAYTLPVTYWKAKWELKPARIVREEISPDEIRETITYEGSRPAENTTNIGKYKVTERIEIKHVRNLNLVPRG